MTLRRDMWYPVATPDRLVGIHHCLRVAGGATASLATFRLTGRFAGLINVEVFGVPTAGAAGPNKNIDFTVNYGRPTEPHANHTGSDTTTLYDLTGTSGEITVIANLVDLFATPGSGDVCTVQVKHTALGGQIDYLGLRVTFVRF